MTFLENLVFWGIFRYVLKTKVIENPRLDTFYKYRITQNPFVRVSYRCEQHVTKTKRQQLDGEKKLESTSVTRNIFDIYVSVCSFSPICVLILTHRLDWHFIFS